jgi:hypothetical protein
MDLIKMLPDVGSPTELIGGQAINGYDSAVWVERYQKPGEFKIKAKLSSGLKSFLPIGTFITHIRTRELMVVESQHIEEAKDKDPTIDITGRSFVGYLGERIIAQNYIASGVNDIILYDIAADETWEQLVVIINDHIGEGFPVDNDDALTNVLSNHNCTGTGTIEFRLIKHGTVLDRVLEILKVDDVGLRILRPTPTDPNIYFNVYQGVDRTAKVQFSTVLADLDNIEYFFSIKAYKNYARVMGRWVQTLATLGPSSGVDRRYIVVDASDIDEQYTAMPTGTDLSNIVNAMIIRGQEILKNKTNLTITRADVSPNSTLQYGRDYFLGDLVTVNGNFNQTQVMRVSEFAEIEDENGTSGQPTLEIPGEE